MRVPHDDYDIFYNPTFDALQVGCQVHTMDHWRSNYQGIAGNHDIPGDQADDMWEWLLGELELA